MSGTGSEWLKGWLDVYFQACFERIWESSDRVVQRLGERVYPE